MSSSHFVPDCDVVVIGGGPAGAAMGAYLGMAGAKVVVFERALFPRPHVGESLVPSSTRVFKELGFLPTMEAAGFPHKHGAVWTSQLSERGFRHQWEGLSPDDFAGIRFDERPQEGVEARYTYHVDRAKFDQLLLLHAHQKGAQVCEGVEVTGVDFEDDCARVRFRLGPKACDLTAKLVIDASGRDTLVGSKLGLKVRDPVFDQLALHTWFDGLDRSIGGRHPGLGEHIHVHFLPLKNSWVWQIPIDGRTTSVGVVTQKKHFLKGGEDREAFFWSCLESRPDVLEAMQRAERMRPFKTEGDYSYAMKEITGDRFVLIGDAARFVDPIFSTGVSIALNSARFASKDVLGALEAGEFRQKSYQTYQDTIRRGTRTWYDFITVYYRLNVLFTAFINDPRYRLDVLQLLQGDVYGETPPPVLEVMRQKVREVESSAAHPWHRMLGDLTAEELRQAF